MGLERPITLRCRLGTDYASWAPGAQEAPHSWRSNGHAMCPLSTITEGSHGHAMCPWSTVPLVTLRNGHFRLFPCFPCFSVFSVYSGGPSLPLWPVLPECSKVARMATLRLLTISGTLGTPGSGPPKVVWSPYSWPPESTESRLGGILGGHTAHFAKSSGSRLFWFS